MQSTLPLIAVFYSFSDLHNVNLIKKLPMQRVKHISSNNHILDNISVPYLDSFMQGISSVVSPNTLISMDRIAVNKNEQLSVSVYDPNKQRFLVIDGLLACMNKSDNNFNKVSRNLLTLENSLHNMSYLL